MIASGLDRSIIPGWVRRLVFNVQAVCSGKITRLLTSAADDVVIAALISSNWPGTRTVAEAEQRKRGNPDAIPDALALNDNLLSVFLEIQASILLVEQTSLPSDPRVDRRDPSNVSHTGRTLRSRIDVALLCIRRAFWEDLALPHRELARQSRRSLKEARKKLVLSKRVGFWLR